MNNLKNSYFYSPSRGNLSFKETIEEIFSYLTKEPEKTYEIVVGCDSASGDKLSFPVAVVILRIGFGGRFFLKKMKYPSALKKKFSNWHQRVLEEVLLSCELALSLKEVLEKKLQNSSINYQFRYIHADIGEKGQTRDMIKEIVGLIRSNGFEAKIKPESFAASVVADRYT